MHKLIIVEGMMGSGKSTTAKFIAAERERDGLGVTESPSTGPAKSSGQTQIDALGSRPIGSSGECYVGW